MRTATILCGVALLAAPSARAGDRFIPILDADLRGAASKVSSANWTGGAIGSIFALPAYKLEDRTTLLPIYSFEGEMFSRAVEEVVLFESRQTHALSLGAKQGLGSGLDARVSLDGAYALTQETRAEKFGKGLYDYRDLGGRVSFAWNLEGFGRKAPLSVGVRSFVRTYPNFRSLAAENAQLLVQENPALANEIAGRENHPKDFKAFEPSVAGSWWWSPELQTKLSYAISARAYTDRYLRTDQGEISTTRRADQLHRIETETSLRGPGDFSTGAGLTWLVNASNGSVYDANQPTHPFIERFYQFSSLALEPWCMWVLQGREGLRPRVRLGASLLGRAYADRTAQLPTGEYTYSRQHDREYGADIKFWYPVSRMVSVLAGADGRIVRSNNVFNQFIRYNYEVLTLSLGASLSY